MSSNEAAKMDLEELVHKLPKTSWAVLGELSFDEELSGYDLKQWAEQSLAFFYWAPSQSQIYSELRRLEKFGLVSSRIEQTHIARSRRLYSITDQGRAAMRAWAANGESEPVVLKHPLMLRVWAAHNGDIADLKTRLHEYRKELVARADHAEGHAARAAGVPSWKYPEIALRWSARYFTDEIARLDWLLEQL